MGSNSILRAQTRGLLVVVAVESTAPAPAEATGSSEREVRAEAALGQGPTGLTGRGLTPGTLRWVKWVYREAAVEEVAPVLPLPRDIAPPEVLVVLELWWCATASLQRLPRFLQFRRVMVRLMWPSPLPPIRGAGQLRIMSIRLMGRRGPVLGQHLRVPRRFLG